MKIKFGFRAIIIIVFFTLFSGSFFYYNKFTLSKIAQFSTELEKIQVDFSNLNFQSEQDEQIAREIAKDVLNSQAGFSMVETEIQMYSGVIVIFLLAISATTFFIIFNKLTKPLKEMEVATDRIKEGDFSVALSEDGIREMKTLKQSFNSMSRQLERTQNRLIVAEKEMMWKELSRILAHEIKNPLTPIQLSIQRLEDRYYSDKNKFDEIFPDATNVIHQEIQNLRNLVQSFSNFAKIQSPDKKVLDAKQELSKILNSYKLTHNIELISVDDFSIQFDQTHFYQIVTNIVQNAIDASSEAGKITLELQRMRSYIVLTIQDKGKGISPEDLRRIFEPYFTKKKRGTGLGLALVKRLAEANGAAVRVHSKEGQGTKFELLMEEPDENSHN